MPAEQKNQRKQQRNTRNHNEEAIVVREGTERRSVVGDVNQMKKVRHDDNRLIRIDRLQDERLRDAVERVKRQRDEQNIFHVVTTFSHRSHRSGCVLLLPTYW